MKKFVSFAAVLMMIFVMAACGGGKTDNSSPQEQEKATGTLFEGEFMSFRYSDDWVVTESENKDMINVEKKNLTGPTLYVLIKATKDSFKTAEEAVVDFAETYDGTPAEKVTYNNIEYFQTSFEYGVAQTMMVTMIGENKVTITLQGAGHEDDQAIKDILNTIELKF